MRTMLSPCWCSCSTQETTIASFIDQSVHCLVSLQSVLMLLSSRESLVPLIHGLCFSLPLFLLAPPPPTYPSSYTLYTLVPWHTLLLTSYYTLCLEHDCSEWCVYISNPLYSKLGTPLPCWVTLSSASSHKTHKQVLPSTGCRTVCGVQRPGCRVCHRDSWRCGSSRHSPAA